MANDLLTIADMVADALDLSPAEVSDLNDEASFLMRLPFEPSSNGTVHKYTKETGAPVVGFRAENTGRDFSHSVDVPVTINLKILDFSWLIDVAVANANKRGRAWKIAREGFHHVKAAMFVLEQQYFQGTGFGGDAAGFAGFSDAAGLDALADEMVIDATGSTADTATSIYLMKFGIDDVSGVMMEGESGGGGPVLNLMDTSVTNHVSSDGKNHPAYYTPGTAWSGLQVGGKYSIARIVNVTEDAGKGATDDLIIDAIEAFPNGTPDVIVMNRRSRKQLRKSRTATNATGAPAPIPEDVEGVPILKTEALLNTEALVA